MCLMVTISNLEFRLRPKTPRCGIHTQSRTILNDLNQQGMDVSLFLVKMYSKRLQILLKEFILQSVVRVSTLTFTVIFLFLLNIPDSH